MGFSPPFVISGIPCEFFVPGEGSQTLVESYGPGGPTATMFIKCAWADRQTVIRGVLGTHAVDAGGVILRRLPLLYFGTPTAADLGIFGLAGPFWVCTSVPNVTGIGWITDQDTGFGGYQDAILQCQCTVPSYDIRDPDLANPNMLSVPFATTTVRTSTEVFTPATKATFFYGGNKDRAVLNGHVGFLATHFEIEIVRHFMPVTCIFTIAQFAGMVNRDPMDAGIVTFMPGEVLFLMGEITPTSDPATGGRLFDIPMRFLCNFGFTWNQLLNDKGEYEDISTPAPASVTPYQEGDLLQLLGIVFPG